MMTDEILDEPESEETIVSVKRTTSKTFKIAFKIFKRLSALFTLLVWIYMIVDDWNLITMHPPSNYEDLFMKFGIYVAYFIVFFIAFTMSFWSIAFLTIIIYDWLKSKR